MNIAKFTIVIVTSLMLVGPVFAEGSITRGSKEHGVNRRVNTNTTGYLGISGSFSAQVFAPHSSDTTIEPNIYKATPTFYLGSYGPGEVDSGMQYYTKKAIYPSGYTLSPDWGAFINHANHTATPASYDADKGEWHGYRFSSEAYSLTYVINSISGFAEIAMLEHTDNDQGGSLQFPWTDTTTDDITNPTPNQFFPSESDGKLVYHQNQMSGIGVKRIVGMTQGAPTGSSQSEKDSFTYRFDGSIITATYSEGKVLDAQSNWHYWSPSIVNQDVTGYDVGQNEKDAQWGRHDTVKSDYILTFPKIDELDDANGNIILTAPAAQAKARMNTQQSYTLTENGSSRYVHETIKISLRSATKITGEKSEPRPRSAGQ